LFPLGADWQCNTRSTSRPVLPVTPYRAGSNVEPNPGESQEYRTERRDGPSMQYGRVLYVREEGRREGGREGKSSATCGQEIVGACQCPTTAAESQTQNTKPPPAPPHPAPHHVDLQRSAVRPTCCARLSSSWSRTNRCCRRNASSSVSRFCPGRPLASIAPDNGTVAFKWYLLMRRNQQIAAEAAAAGTSRARKR